MARTKTTFKGGKVVIANLNKEIAKIENLTEAGMHAATLFVKGESIRVTPVEYGNLRQSAYTEVFRKKNIITGIIGYRSAIALYVHEALGILKGIPRRSGIGVYWGPSGIPGFLRESIMKNQRKILNILRDAARIK